MKMKKMMNKYGNYKIKRSRVSVILNLDLYFTYSLPGYVVRVSAISFNDISLFTVNVPI